VVQYDEALNLEGVKSRKETIVELLKQLQDDLAGSDFRNKEEMENRLFGEVTRQPQRN